MQSKKKQIKKFFLEFSSQILFLFYLNFFVFLLWTQKMYLCLWFLMKKKTNQYHSNFMIYFLRIKKTTIYRSRKFISNVHGWNKAFNKITNWNKLPIFFYMTKIWTKIVFFLMFTEYKYYSTSKKSTNSFHFEILFGFSHSEAKFQKVLNKMKN